MLRWSPPLDDRDVSFACTRSSRNADDAILLRFLFVVCAESPLDVVENSTFGQMYAQLRSVPASQLRQKTDQPWEVRWCSADLFVSRSSCLLGCALALFPSELSLASCLSRSSARLLPSLFFVFVVILGVVDRPDCVWLPLCCGAGR